MLALFLLGLCIFVHELGHFLAAKWRKLHIVAFSIGFKKVWGFRHNDIDYRIGCIPCGGYVDLPQIDATGEPKDEHGNPLPAAKPVDRIVTAFAGPFFNILFGLALSLLVWWVGVPQDTPKMSEIKVRAVDDDSPEYRSGLRQGDVITSVNGQSFVYSWNEFVRAILFTEGDVTLGVRRDGRQFEVVYTPEPNEKKMPEEKIAYPFFLPLVPLECVVKPGSQADSAGLRTGDVILELNGREMTDSDDLLMALRMNEGHEIRFTVLRNSQRMEIGPIKPVGSHSLTYRAGIQLSDSFNAVVSAVGPAGAGVDYGGMDFKVCDNILRIDGRLVDSEEMLERVAGKKDGVPVSFLVKRGDEPLEFTKHITTGDEAKDKSWMEVTYSYSMPFWISYIPPGTPAEGQGFRRYDRLLKLDGRDITDFDYFIRTVSDSGGRDLPIVIERDGRRLEKTLTPKPFYPYRAEDIGLELVIKEYPTPIRQFEMVVSMTYKSLRGIMSRKSTLRPRHLSGPIGIVRGIGVAFSHGGIMPVVGLLVLITYSLAILNLMPLPVLDGGHIVLALYEMAVGKPMSAKIVKPLFVVFVVLLISMMLYVTFYDALRLKPRTLSSVTKRYRYAESPSENQSD
ncbi:MAG: site-2 protease family protein [Victivallales bacterium]|nr:site-2 protease family protein [Victivallales bacterium]